MPFYIILSIDEPDFGCEGLPDGQEPLCDVVLQSETGETRRVKIADALLYEKDLDVGSILQMDDSGAVL